MLSPLASPVGLYRCANVCHRLTVGFYTMPYLRIHLDFPQVLEMFLGIGNRL
jgi:hypothetical protein